MDAAQRRLLVRARAMLHLVQLRDTLPTKLERRELDAGAVEHCSRMLRNAMRTAGMPKPADLLASAREIVTKLDPAAASSVRPAPEPVAQPAPAIVVPDRPSTRTIHKSECDVSMLIVVMEDGAADKPVLHLGRLERRQFAPGVKKLWAVWLLAADRKSEFAWTGPSTPGDTDRGAWLEDLEGDQVMVLASESPPAGEGLRTAAERALLLELNRTSRRMLQRSEA